MLKQIRLGGKNLTFAFAVVLYRRVSEYSISIFCGPNDIFMNAKAAYLSSTTGAASVNYCGAIYMT